MFYDTIRSDNGELKLNDSFRKRHGDSNAVCNDLSRNDMSLSSTVNETWGIEGRNKHKRICTARVCLVNIDRQPSIYRALECAVIRITCNQPVITVIIYSSFITNTSNDQIVGSMQTFLEGAIHEN
jgi:hypothetical protein